MREDEANGAHEAGRDAAPVPVAPSPAALLDELRREKASRVELEGALADALEAASDLAGRAAHRQATLAQARATIARLTVDLAESRGALRAIESSRIWRLSRPYRRAMGLLRRLPRPGGHADQTPARDTAAAASEDALLLKARPTGLVRDHDVDVCIVTNCRFPGGNASSTIEELRALSEAGLSVLLVHVPLEGRPKPLSERYLPWFDRLEPAEDVGRVRCRLLILRGPRLPHEPAFLALADRVEADQAVLVVNNSALRPDGTPVFRWPDLLAFMAARPWPLRAVHPLGPAIREEAEALGHGPALAPFDWTPTFDAAGLAFQPRHAMVPPLVIGRHGRDGREKWAESPEALRAAYPDDPDLRVRILGGADRARQILGGLPANWIVYPFGGRPVPAFLAELDAFVYFPHSDLVEAFGRTVVEAMFAGLPCLLPPRFRATFGDLAFYAEPEGVRGALRRLARDDAARLSYLTAVREEAEARFSSASLLDRAPALGRAGRRPPPAPLAPSHLAWRAWVETGA